MGKGAYGNVEFWDEYYVVDRPEPYDWFFPCSHLAPLLRLLLPNLDASILMPGCGNAPFSEEMHALGYTNQVNFDNCALVIEQQKVRMPQMAWEVEDVRSMSYEADRFDVVLDKGLLDNLYCYADPENNCARAIADMYRVLLPGGAFIILSCHDPAEVTGTLSAWPWSRTEVVRLRNPRFPEVRVPAFTLVVAIKGGDPDKNDSEGLPSTPALGVAEEQDGAGQGHPVPRECCWAVPGADELGALISPDDSLPLCVSAEELTTLQARATALNEASRADLLARQAAQADALQRWQQQHGQQQQAAQPLPPAPEASEQFEDAGEEYVPPNGTFADQLARRRSSLRVAPPLPPQKPLLAEPADEGASVPSEEA